MSTSEFSSSDSGFARFLGFGTGALFVTFRVVCLVALGFGAAAAFFAGAFAGAFAFYTTLVAYS
jgi:hypothetical protein